MLIPANTVVWVPFVFDTTAGSMQNNYITAELNVYLYSDYPGMSITVGMYGSNGALLSIDKLGIAADYCQSAPCAWMGASPSGTSNQIISNESGKATVSFPINPTNLTLQQGSTFYVAFVATHAIWVGGFSAADRSGGNGLQYGQSPWEAPVTYEGSAGQQQAATLPTSLPQATLTSSFEIAINGNVGIPEG
jgi:hypothetical protein